MIINTTITFSVATRESVICQGEIARSNELNNAIPYFSFDFSNSSKTRKKTSGTVNEPKNAAGNRVEVGVKSKIAVEGIVRYA